MKKVNFRNVVMAFAFALGFLLSGSEQLSAQSTTLFSVLHPAPNVTFVSAQQAEAILVSAISQQKNILMQNLKPEDPVHVAASRLYIYYSGILDELHKGKAVGLAIENGLIYLNDSNGNGNLPKQQLSQLKQGAINLLKK